MKVKAYKSNKNKADNCHDNWLVGNGLNEARYETFITPIYFTREELEHRVRVGSPFIYEVLKEGVALYDDGTFKRIREKVFGAGG